MLFESSASSLSRRKHTISVFISTLLLSRYVMEIYIHFACSLPGVQFNRVTFFRVSLALKSVWAGGVSVSLLIDDKSRLMLLPTVPPHHRRPRQLKRRHFHKSLSRSLFRSLGSYVGGEFIAFN
jgi:hypothetical protein